MIEFSGRATLISDPKRQTSENRPITHQAASMSSPTFNQIEHYSRSYSLSRSHSNNDSPTTTRRTSTSDVYDKSRRSLISKLFEKLNSS